MGPRLKTGVGQDVKSGKMKISFPDLEKSWKIEKHGKVMKFIISLKPVCFDNHKESLSASQQIKLLTPFTVFLFLIRKWS